ncbi:hypothetical protein B0I35DRAFT_477806 [Stachybotrys elegans]|uniref:Uncharacterized protein n=1 Tax=Stachybotrys elegans TaxID=80388 RepID=A0A8K0WU64_9HYPO|nr:hypothetical protein B0I35DRAFT_477806 [Stachybotrys elegans]
MCEQIIRACQYCGSHTPTKRLSCDIQLYISAAPFIPLEELPESLLPSACPGIKLKCLPYGARNCPNWERCIARDVWEEKQVQEQTRRIAEELVQEARRAAEMESQWEDAWELEAWLQHVNHLRRMPVPPRGECESFMAQGKRDFMEMHPQPRPQQNDQKGLAEAAAPTERRPSSVTMPASIPIAQADKKRRDVNCSEWFTHQMACPVKRCYVRWPVNKGQPPAAARLDAWLNAPSHGPWEPCGRADLSSAAGESAVIGEATMFPDTPESKASDDTHELQGTSMIAPSRETSVDRSSVPL